MPVAGFVIRILRWSVCFFIQGSIHESLYLPLQVCFTCVQKNKVMFTPEEYANLFMKMYEANYVEGLFLTSAIFRSADSRRIITGNRSFIAKQTSFSRLYPF